MTYKYLVIVIIIIVMECAICLTNIITSCVGSCNHHFCAECLLKWCKTNNICPKCKYVIREIKADPEFDYLVYILLNNFDDRSNEMYGGNGNYSLFGGLHSKITCEIIISFPPNSTAGITLKNCDGPGVKITKLDYNGRARICGLRVGDVIISINNVPCINHKQTIGIFDEGMFSNKDVKCLTSGNRFKSRIGNHLPNNLGGEVESLYSWTWE